MLDTGGVINDISYWNLLSDGNMIWIYVNKEEKVHIKGETDSAPVIFWTLNNLI